MPVTASIAAEELSSSARICSAVNFDMYECVELCVPISCPASAIFFTYSGYFSAQNSTMKKVARTFAFASSSKMASVCSFPQAQSKEMAIFFSSVSTE